MQLSIWSIFIDQHIMEDDMANLPQIQTNLSNARAITKIKTTETHMLSDRRLYYIDLITQERVL